MYIALHSNTCSDLLWSLWRTEWISLSWVTYVCDTTYISMCCSEKSHFNEVDHSFFLVGDSNCIQLDLEMLVSTFVCEKLPDYCRDSLNYSSLNSDPIYYPTTTTNLLLLRRTMWRGLEGEIVSTTHYSVCKNGNSQQVPATCLTVWWNYFCRSIPIFIHLNFHEIIFSFRTVLVSFRDSNYYL